MIGIFGRRRKIVNCVSRLNTNFDAKIKKFDSLQKDFNQKFDKIDERLTKLEVGQAKLTEKVDGMDRRLEKVEGTQKIKVRNKGNVGFRHLNPTYKISDRTYMIDDFGDKAISS